MISEELKKNYEEVLTDLHTRRSEQARVLAEIDQTIASIAKLIQPEMAPSSSEALPFPPPVARMSPMHQSRFGDMSVRWGILWLLNEASLPMSVGEIAEALRAGGVITKATNFSNNVSAVLSDMKAVRREVEVDSSDGRWRISTNGRSVWSHISTHRLNLRNSV